ncbi:MAG: hypothetical protein HZB59_06900 [Ignavibacteriales bacterium]|nr:hypothetical protein [Ignavibacteriales bacterium]
MNLRSKEKSIAQEIASSLNDPESLSLYELYARKYSEPLLRKILDEVLRVPAERIKKSRGALFTYLLKKYAHSKQYNDRD